MLSKYIQIVEGSQKGRFFSIPDGKMILGRHLSSDIQIIDNECIVSNYHASLTSNETGIFIEDCNSTNGLYVNEIRVSETVLNEGDIIGLGEKGPRLKLLTNKFNEIPETVIIENRKNESGLPQKIDTTEEIKKSEKEALNSNNLFNAENDDGNSLNDINFSLSNVPLTLVGNDYSANKDLLEEKQEKDKVSSDNIFTTREIEEKVFEARKEKRKKSDQNRKKTDQEIMISKFAKVLSRRQQTIYFWSGAVVFVLIIVAGYFAYGYYKYERMFKEGLRLKHEAAQADKELEKLWDINDTTLSRKEQVLANKIRKKQNRLDSVMSLLPARFHQRFFADSVERYLYEIMSNFHEPYYTIPSHMLQRVKHYISLNRSSRSATVIKGLKRLEKYRKYIQRVFQDNRVPPELIYVALQESMFDPNARSHAGAAGMWQFMKSTAQRFNLHISESHDDRLDWQKSTIAAAEYFHDLLAEFGKGGGVLLAIAAYNAGENKIRRALRKIEDPLRDRDFWYLYRTSNELAEETREYVPQVLALMILDTHREEMEF